MMTKFDKSEEWLRNKYREENMGPTEISDLEKVNVSPGAISNWVKKFDISKKHKDKEWLKQKYIEENLSSIEISDICDTCPQTVLNWLERFNIDRPSSSNLWDVYEAPLEGVTGTDHPWWGRTGEEHPRYKGEDYSWRSVPEWRKIRNMIKSRDKYLCQICSISQSESDENLHAHHIVPVSEGGKKLDPDNLMTLCGNCHRKVHNEYYKNTEPDWDEETYWVTEETAVY